MTAQSQKDWWEIHFAIKYPVMAVEKMTKFIKQLFCCHNYMTASYLSLNELPYHVINEEDKFGKLAVMLTICTKCKHSIVNAMICEEMLNDFIAFEKKMNKQEEFKNEV